MLKLHQEKMETIKSKRKGRLLDFSREAVTGSSTRQYFIHFIFLFITMYINYQLLKFIHLLYFIKHWVCSLGSIRINTYSKTSLEKIKMLTKFKIREYRRSIWEQDGAAKLVLG